MPKRLDTNKVKNEFASYGYTLPKNFKHKTVTTRYKMIDNLTGKEVLLSLNELRYRVGRNERSLVSANGTATANDMVADAARATTKKSKLKMLKPHVSDSTDYVKNQMQMYMVI